MGKRREEDKKKEQEIWKRRGKEEEKEEIVGGRSGCGDGGRGSRRGGVFCCFKRKELSVDNKVWKREGLSFVLLPFDLASKFGGWLSCPQNPGKVSNFVGVCSASPTPGFHIRHPRFPY